MIKVVIAEVFQHVKNCMSFFDFMDLCLLLIPASGKSKVFVNLSYSQIIVV